jgi:threonine/homoserine/homoserine lactone efflux protein
MRTIAAGTPQLPVWAVIAGCAYMLYMFLSSARAEERRRREEGQPHTKRDTALLLLTGLCVVGVILLAIFLKPLNVLVNSRLGIAAIILVVGGGLTYIFNRKRTSHSR